MKIEFKNDSSIESIPSSGSNIRSKRAEEYIRYLKENPYAYIDMFMSENLKWYQKLYLKIYCFIK